MAVSDFLFQSAPPAAFTAEVQQRTDMPDWYQAARRQLISRASQITGEPYQPYQGPRIAGLTADQANAFQQVRNTNSTGNSMLNESADMIRTGGQGFNQQKFDSYMNPYRDDMMGELRRQAGKNLTENLLPGVNDAFTGSGMFGASRHGDFTGRAVRDTQESLLGQQAGVLNSAYDKAMGFMNQDIDRTVGAGKDLGALGQIMFNQGLQGAGALEAVGQTQQNQTQKSYDLGYQDFLDQRDQPIRNLELMSGVINAYTPNPNQVKTSQTPITQDQYQLSPLQQLLARMSGSSNSSGTTGTGTNVR